MRNYPDMQSKKRFLHRNRIQRPLTENWRVDSEEPGKGQVGEQREAAAGHQPDAQLLGLDLAEFLGKPRPSPVAGRRPRRLGRPRVRR